MDCFPDVLYPPRPQEAVNHNRIERIRPGFEKQISTLPRETIVAARWCVTHPRRNSPGPNHVNDEKPDRSFVATASSSRCPGCESLN